MKTKFAPQTAPKSSWKNSILLIITVLALSMSAAFGATTTWTDGVSSWFLGTNWNNGEPHSMTDALINNGGTAQISANAPMAEALSLTLGLNAGNSGSVEVIPFFGDLRIGQAIFVGKRGTGKLTSTFGMITSATASIASLTGGPLPPSNGAATIDGTGTSWVISGRCDVGGYNDSPGGVALLSVTNGGTVTAGSVRVYDSGTLTGNGTVTVNSPSTPVVTVDGTLAPSGTLTINGNLTFANPAANMRCNVSSTSVDNVQVSGRALLNGKLSVTVSVTGDFTLLHAGNGRNGTTFSSYSFTYTGCLSASVSYQDNPATGSSDVILHVVSTCN
jgi:T5SS/PEP-CTERM-associated repeat protein